MQVFRYQFNTVLQQVLNFFIFGNIFIACCAVLMVYQTQNLFGIDQYQNNLLAFTFFATLSSYNLHWYLTKPNGQVYQRQLWNAKYKSNIKSLFLTSLPFVFYFATVLSKYWPWLFIVSLMTFLYTAPKIPHYFFRHLKKIAFGKTIFLSLVWTMVTVMLPLAIAELKINLGMVLFFVNRFFFIYTICILFDWRDREQDKLSGIISLVTHLDPEKIVKLFYISILLFFVSGIFLYYVGFSVINLFILISPGIILLLLFRLTLKGKDDYFYYVVLDGLMALSGLVFFVYRLIK